MVGSGPPTQTLLSLLHLPRLPQGIKLDVRGKERGRGGERERGRAREGGRERRKKAQAGIYFLCLDKGRIRGNCLLFSLFSAAKPRFIECLQRSLSFFFSF